MAAYLSRFSPDLPRQQKVSLHEPLESTHVVLAWTAIILIPLHVAAAVYHQFIRRDELLLRMLPYRRVRRGDNAMTMRTALVLMASMTVLPVHAAQHWNVDYAKSKLGFTVNWSGEPFNAVFRSWKADIDFDPADLAHARAIITIDLASETSSDRNRRRH